MIEETTDVAISANFIGLTGYSHSEVQGVENSKDGAKSA
jgi:hypothetical protein